MMQLSQICEQVHGTLAGSDVMVNNISINSREDCEDRLFVALKGENFDAHGFIEAAAQAGAAAVMVEQGVSTDLPSIRVASTHQALKDLAAWWRRQFAIPVIGVTGSVGKTTVKEMLGSIFSELGKGVVTKGNLNNEIGVPLTIMNLSADDRFAIVEMGMNHAGEIERLSHIALPTIALVNNAAAAHLEGLGSVEAVARAKGEIFAGLTSDGVAIINQDDEYSELWLTLIGEKRVVSFGLTGHADVSATYVEENEQLVLDVSAFEHRFKVTINSVGEHTVRNVLAAVAVSLAANVPTEHIQSGLQKFQPVNGRLNITTTNGVRVIDDTYNANPASMRAAIEVLSGAADSCLIVGDMAELGASAQVEHENIGVFAAHHEISTLLACGEYAEFVVKGFGKRGQAFNSQSELTRYLTDNLPSGSVLVKGSRSARMERVVEVITGALEANANRSSDDTPDHNKKGGQ